MLLHVAIEVGESRHGGSVPARTSRFDARNAGRIVGSRGLLVELDRQHDEDDREDDEDHRQGDEDDGQADPPSPSARTIA